MSDQPDLTVLSIKDLRQLAGEHQIQNRSRLGKDDLIQALQGVLAGHLAASAAAAVGSISATVAVPAPSPAKEPEEISSVELKAATVAETVHAEPEVLDAAAVADLANDSVVPANAAPAAGEVDPTADPGHPGERRRRRRRRRGRGRGRRDENGNPIANDQDGQSAEGDDGEDGDDGDAVHDGQLRRRPVLRFALLDEEVDSDRDHRPDARHEHGE